MKTTIDKQKTGKKITKISTPTTKPTSGESLTACWCENPGQRNFHACRTGGNW